MGTVSQLHPKSAAPHLDEHNLATSILFRDRWENRITALQNCIEHLVVNHDVPEHRAEIIALQAYAECESVNQSARIDLEASTSSLLVLRTASGCPVAFTLTDLVRLLERARAEGAAKVVDRDARRPVVLEH